MDVNQYRYVPVLCVVGYNRPDSLQRVLGSLAHSACPEGVQLVISIDRGKPGDPANEAVVAMAEAFVWERGEKEVLFRAENQGLPDHIIVCGDLAEKYGSVLIIEDDLYLAPYFYQYAIEATNFYADDDRVAGIGLYGLGHNNHAHNLPFHPIKEGTTGYFVQSPCSWGQVWTREQWQKFRPWWNARTGFTHEDQIPEDIKHWGDRAWDNHFNKYLWETDRYFIFPYEAYSTNFTDAGTHFSGGTFFQQVSLQMGEVPLQFKPFEEAIARYDNYYELKPEVINQFVPELKQYDYIVDLYGVKQLDIFEEQYVLTLKSVPNPILSFGGAMKPFAMNVLLQLPGNMIHLVKKSDLKDIEEREPGMIYDYHFSFIPIKALMRLLRARVKARLKK